MKEERTVKEERMEKERVAEDRFEEEPVETARAEERRPEEERVAEREVESEATGPAVPVAQLQADGRGVGAVPAVVVPLRRRDGVAHRTVVEVAVGLHALHYIEQRLPPVVAGLARGQDAIIPVIAPHELLDLERRPRAGGEHQPRARALLDRERLATAAAADFDHPAAAREGVVARVEREQHPDPTVGVDAQHDEVAVLRDLHVHARLIATLEMPVLVKPDLHWRVAPRSHPLHPCGRGSCEREEQRQNHA